MFLLLFVLNWSIDRNRNWAKWSEIDVTMFSDIALSDISVKKIFSITVLECEVIWVGDVIWSTKEIEYIWSWKSAAFIVFYTLVNQCWNHPIKRFLCFSLKAAFR